MENSITPQSVYGITLKQWVDFYALYGRELARRAAALATEEERREYDIDYTLLHYCHYTGRNMAEVMEAGDLPHAYREQTAAFMMHRMQEDDLSYHDVYEWQGGQWKVQPVLQKSGRLMEEESEQCLAIALIWADLQDGRTEAHYALCAAFFREVGEPYDAGMTADGSVRIKLMEELPLAYALCVKKYLNDTIDTYLNGRRG